MFSKNRFKNWTEPTNLSVFVIAVLLVSIYTNAAAQIKAVIFDCDGVLVDTEQLKFEAWREALSKYKIDFTLDDYLPLVGHSSEKIALEIEKQKKISLNKTVLIQESKAIYKKRQIQGIPPIPAAVSFLKSLLKNKAEYGVKVGLCSSGSHLEINRNLESIGVDPKDFDAIASGDDDLKYIVDPDGTNKPKPYIYQFIAKSLNIEPRDAIVFEDTNAGVEAAVTAGMRVLATPNYFTDKHNFSKAIQVISFKNREPKALLEEFKD